MHGGGEGNEDGRIRAMMLVADRLAVDARTEVLKADEDVMAADGLGLRPGAGVIADRRYLGRYGVLQHERRR